MRRVVVLGPGGSGKSTFARSLGAATDIPVIELDKHFWASDLQPTPREEWINVQEGLVRRDAWTMDGDLGPFDAVEVRLRGADTVVILDLPTLLCAWRSFRRSWERPGFWRWLLVWRRRYKPRLMRAVAEHAGPAELVVVRSRRRASRLLAELVGGAQVACPSAGSVVRALVAENDDDLPGVWLHRRQGQITPGGSG